MVQKYFIFISFLVMFLAASAYPAEWEWTTYTAADGLADNFVMAILEDRQGNLWFATNGGGVSKYDGQHFKNFTTADGLPSNMVMSAFEDSKGNLWFGTYAGVVKYNGKRFQQVSSGKGGLEDTIIRSILEDENGNIWFGSFGTYGGEPGGLVKCDGVHFQYFTTADGLLSNNVMALLRARKGNFWIGYIGQKSVSMYDGREFHTYPIGDGLVSTDVAAIFEDGSGNIWFGSGFFRSGIGVTKYDGQSFQTFTVEDGLPGPAVISILEDREGNLWFGTWGGGVSKYDGKSFQNFTIKDGLANNIAFSILEDREGNLWFGTWYGGLSKYAPQAFETFPEMYLLLEDSKGNLWFKTKDGVSKYDGKEFQLFIGADVQRMLEDSKGHLWFRNPSTIMMYDGQNHHNFKVPGGDRYLSILEDSKGNVWFGSDKGPYIYDGERLRKISSDSGVENTRIECIFEDKTGNLWFGAYPGVYRYDGQTFQLFTKDDGLMGNWIWDIIEDKEGNLWFMPPDFSQTGTCRYDGKTFQTFTVEDGLASDGALSILLDREGNIWFGTWQGGGVSRYDGKEFRNFTAKDGLANNTVNAILQDRNGNFWFGTNGGVSRFDGVNFQTINRRDGLLDDAVVGISVMGYWNKNALLEDRAGNIWIVTNRGTNKYTPPQNTKPPRIYITQVDADKRYTDLDLNHIKSTAQSVTFHYQGVSFKTRPDGMRYTYKLDGYDKDWHSTSENSAYYENLKTGNYLFNVKAIDRDLNYSQPADLTLKVVPPFYFSAVFLFPTVGGGTLLLATVVILATALIKRRHQIRAYERAAVLELQDANRVQMSLMPETAPEIEGVEIAGKCIPANTVSGDFFDYLVGKRNNEIALIVADVTGKSMKGAMNAVMTDGILRAAAKEQEQFSPASLMVTLNDVLKGSMEWGMNVTMVIAMIHRNRVFRKNHVLEQSEGSVAEWETTLTLANAAHHAHPLLLRLGLSSQEPTHAFGLANEVTYRNQGEVQKLESGGLPLGMRAGVQYTEEQFELQSGDVLILMTDGIIEALDNEEHYYSDSGRLEETIRKFTQDISAEAMVDAIIGDAIAFGNGKASRDDDMTVVVAKIQ